MSAGYRTLNRKELIKFLVGLGLQVYRGGDHDRVAGVFNGRNISPFQIPNTHGKGKSKGEYGHTSDKIKALRKKLGLTTGEFYDLVEEVLG